VANCTAWLLYGTLTKDPYVYFSNFLGLPLGFFYVFTTVKFANEKVSRSVLPACHKHWRPLAANVAGPRQALYVVVLSSELVACC
jgi:hypothetical protein